MAGCGGACGGCAAEKLEEAEAAAAQSSGGLSGFLIPVEQKGKEEGQLSKIARDAAKAAVEQSKGMSSQARARRRSRDGAAHAAAELTRRFAGRS